MSDGGLGEVVLVFQSNNVVDLSRRIRRAFSTWDSWLNIMMDALRQEPIAGNWAFEWREFLSGESGWITKEWYEPVSDEERLVAMNHLIEVSKSMLRSLLSSRQFYRDNVVELVDWLESLKVLPYVVGYEPNPELKEALV
jgi:hypothetical protein